ncbi:MAG: TlpA family protein disulfide reductase [Rhodobacteraceae bacterium]|nr:MAG: TlpA family protein disulfide reductase [Paracoccaceae bacterium]
MKQLLAAILYMALAAGANAADLEAAASLRDGDMKKLNFAPDPAPVSDAAFLLEDGTTEGRLSDYRGKWVLLNFWATWCAPCRKEMPMLAELQTEFGGETFEVVTLATGRNSPQGIARFFDEIGVDNLPQFRDPQSAVAREMAVLGLPVTVIVDPEGREVARLLGDADWASDSAKAILRSLIGAEG